MKHIIELTKATIDDDYDIGPIGRNGVGVCAAGLHQFFTFPKAHPKLELVISDRAHRSAFRIVADKYRPLEVHYGDGKPAVPVDTFCALDAALEEARVKLGVAEGSSLYASLVIVG